LVFELWERGIARVPERSPDGEGGDPRARELWSHIEAHPEDEAGHEAFLGYCQVSRQLDLAARRYQGFLLANPESRLGAAFRDRIVVLAQFDRKPARKPRRPGRPYRALKIMIAIGVAALIWILFAARMKLGWY
jgi:hypothetical protein